MRTAVQSISLCEPILVEKIFCLIKLPFTETVFHILNRNLPENRKKKMKIKIKIKFS